MKGSSYRVPPVYSTVNLNVLLVDRWNSRLKILDYRHLNDKELHSVSEYAQGKGLEKIIAYVPESHADLMEKSGYVIEGAIEGFLNGRDVWCCSLFLDPERCKSRRLEEEKRIIAKCIDSQPIPAGVLENTFRLVDGNEAFADDMAFLFASVFESYPSPVMDAGYLKHTMHKGNILYRLALDHNRIVGIASAEIDGINRNAELTDCVTHPAYRGQGINRCLLNDLETELRLRGIGTAYSLARAAHAPINYVFHSQGFMYTGRLVNNCQICGSYEDMNIWVKRLV